MRVYPQEQLEHAMYNKIFRGRAWSDACPGPDPNTYNEKPRVTHQRSPDSNHTLKKHVRNNLSNHTSDCAHDNEPLATRAGHTNWTPLSNPFSVRLFFFF
mmetsp:Transcript_8342/g.27324  ORF Transcript_8342/g.27324 Transcript_8342/m.27324 type:complete len:100 (+) Transcript_8342:12-311(+)